MSVARARGRDGGENRDGVGRESSTLPVGLRSGKHGEETLAAVHSLHGSYVEQIIIDNLPYTRYCFRNGGDGSELLPSYSFYLLGWGHR